MAPQGCRPLAIQTERRGDAAVVTLIGAATIDQAERLNSELRQIAACESVKRIVLDLGRLDFICSMGLGALIVAHVVGQRHGAQVVLAAPQPAIRRVLETTRLNLIFPIFDEAAAAVG